MLFSFGFAHSVPNSENVSNTESSTKSRMHVVPMPGSLCERDVRISFNLFSSLASLKLETNNHFYMIEISLRTYKTIKFICKHDMYILPYKRDGLRTV